MYNNWAQQLPELLIKIRFKKYLSRGQLARHLKTTPSIIYNLENGRSRIKFSYFLSLLQIIDKDPLKLFSHHIFSIKELHSLDYNEIIKTFRTRLKYSQKEMAKSLGYKSTSIIHHFEKGLREPSLKDIFRLMILAGDNIYGLILDITGDKNFAAYFPIGEEKTQHNWKEYWSKFYIPAMRQIMRSTVYGSINRYRPGYFANILGISEKEERHGLDVLGKFNIIKWENLKPVINSEIKILMPEDIEESVIDNLKEQWLEFGKKKYLEYKITNKDNNFLSIDIIPVNKKIYKQITEMIRGLQDDIHNIQLTETDGFIYLGWSAIYVAAKKN